MTSQPLRPEDLPEPDIGQRAAAPWFQNAKLGIFIHWGVYAVPGWGPLGDGGRYGRLVDIKNLNFTALPLAEWYLFGLRIGGEAAAYHNKRYGKAFDYYDFVPMFEAASTTWDAHSWAELFSEAGARYAVLTTKHHEGYCLWPSAVPHTGPGGRRIVSERDLVGEYVSAMRAAGLRAGLYYSGGIDWSFSTERPDLEGQVQKAAQNKRDVEEGRPPTHELVSPATQEYFDYADQHLLELVERYRPDVLWNDIGYPRNSQIRRILSHYARTVPDGVFNDRFNLPFADYSTKEYELAGHALTEKWEACRGLGSSWGFNRAEGEADLLTPEDLIQDFVDVVSKNGNMLINVGPRPDGSIPGSQVRRLKALGAWLRINGDAIYDTVPWKRPSDVSVEGLDVRYTQSADAVYALILDRRGEDFVTLPNVDIGGCGAVIDTPSGRLLKWRATQDGLRIHLPSDDGRIVPALRIVGAERAGA
jgi:alpha-L-fucosidase